MELECPNCGSYDCYFDGLQFVCDDCGLIALHILSGLNTTGPQVVESRGLRFSPYPCEFHPILLYLS